MSFATSFRCFNASSSSSRCSPNDKELSIIYLGARNSEWEQVKVGDDKKECFLFKMKLPWRRERNTISNPHDCQFSVRDNLRFCQETSAKPRISSIEGYLWCLTLSHHDWNCVMMSWQFHRKAHGLEESSKSYFSQISSLVPEIFTILYKCPGRKKKEERKKKILNLLL